MHFGALIDPVQPLVIESLDDLDESYGETSVVRRYEPEDDPDDPWIGIEHRGHVLVSCCIFRVLHLKIVFRCVLSEEGMVNIYGPGGIPDETYQIPDAGVWRKGAAGYGYVSRIRAIGDGLYVCGDARQVYRFMYPSNAPDAATLLKRGRFVHTDAGMLQTPMPEHPGDDASEEAQEKWLEASDTCNFSDIAGSADNDIYAVGDEVWHYDGQSWRELDMPNGGERLTAIKVIDAATVVLVGVNGYVLQGNAREGFRNLSSVDDNQTFTGVEWFEGQLWLASNIGLFVLNAQTQRIEKYRTDLKVDLVDTHLLEAKDGVLWSFGFKDLAYFDTRQKKPQWTRVHHPDNPRVDALPAKPKRKRALPAESASQVPPDIPSWLPASPSGASSPKDAWDTGGLIARVGHSGVGAYVAAQLKLLGLSEAQVLQFGRNGRYVVAAPQVGLELTLEYTGTAQMQKAAQSEDWALAEVKLLGSGAPVAWKGWWPGGLRPDSPSATDQALAVFGEADVESGSQLSFFVNGAHGASWVVNLDRTADGQLVHLKVLNLGGYLPWQVA